MALQPTADEVTKKIDSVGEKKEASERARTQKKKNSFFFREWKIV